MKLPLVLLLTLALVATAALDAHRGEFTADEILNGRVAHIADGDTIRLQKPDGRSVRIRLYGIDAPESDQPYGAESTAFLKQLIADESISVRVVRIGRYGRVIGEIFRPRDRASVNLRIVPFHF